MSAMWGWPYPMPDGSELCRRLTETEEAVRRLSDRLGQLERQLGDRLGQLDRQLEDMKAKPPIHVEYHFDQLKVNELKGTLNVGLSPQGPSGIEAFDVPAPSEAQPEAWTVTQAVPADPVAGSIADMQGQMGEYMDRQAARLLWDLERRYGLDLGETLRDRVVLDVKNQLNDRVHYYARTSPYPENGNEDDRRRWMESVLRRTARDVEAAFAAYLQGYRGKSENREG